MSTPRQVRRYGAYHRVSDANGRDLDAETTITHKDAFEQMDAWARMRPNAVIAERYLDWDQSGARMARPELDRLLADLEAGRIDGIVVAQVDRLSRAEVGDALATVKQLAGPDVNHPRPIVLLDLGIDPSTEFGEFGLTVLLALARMQWRRYKRQRESAQERAAARGVWMGRAPVGYVRDEHGTLQIDPVSAEVVREAFRLAGSRHDGLNAADRHLAEFLGRRSHVSDTRKVLSSRAYLGEHHRPDGVGHEPLVSPATFEAAQTTKRGKRRHGHYPLTHIATCAGCGGGLTGGLQTIRGREYRRMRCAAQTTPECVGSVTAPTLEDLVRDRLRVALADASFRLGYDVGGEAEAQAALEAAEEERTRFAQDADAHTLLGEEAWRAGVHARAQRVNEARDQLGAIAAQSSRSSLLPAPDQLDDPQHFAQALSVVSSVEVTAGRRPVSERVTIKWSAMVDDLDDDAGVFAA